MVRGIYHHRTAIGVAQEGCSGDDDDGGGGVAASGGNDDDDVTSWVVV